MPFGRTGPVVLMFAIILVIGVSGTSAGDVSNPVRGTLSVVWGDGAPGSVAGSTMRYFLGTDSGDVVELAFGENGLPGVGGLWRLHGQRIEVWFGEPGITGGPRPVVALSGLTREGARDVTGSKPWISVLCKFPDVAAEPNNLAFFQGMFDNAPGRLDHFWREVSYNNIDVVGSTAVNWTNLPQNQTFYVPNPGAGCLDGDPENDADLFALFDDCTAAVDGFVDFSNGGTPFEGINLIFNSDLDGCAWGGGMPATLDGVNKMWRTTWEPPWGYANVAVMAHEMGHGFGLPHSNNWDDDGSPYDNSWDVMSDTWSYAGWDSTYGTMGKHTIAYHKDILGWIPADKRFEASSEGSWTITIDDLALASTSNYRMAKIAISSSTSFYTVETRDLTGHYDSYLPGNAVIIHEVDPTRYEPAWCYDETVPPGDDSSGEGSMWRVGETFADVANGISVSVDSATPDGFQVTITRSVPGLIFADGFETGNANAWNP